MSRESIQDLNSGNRIKLGFTDKRGDNYAWHYDAAVAAQNIDDGHARQYYPGAIPVGEAIADIFNWQALSAPVQFVDQNGQTHETTDQVIYRSDTGEVLKTGFKDGYRIHQYSEDLLDIARKITTVDIAGEANINNGTVSDMLGLSSVGVLKGGKVAWWQFELPENIKTKHDIVFRPSLLLGSSMDGTIASQAKLVETMVVCDNTFDYARSEKNAAVKVKHTKYSQAALLNGADTLGLIIEHADEFGAAMDELLETKVSGLQFKSFIAQYAPIPEDLGRSRTMAEKLNDELMSLYLTDERVAPFAGTAFGVLQMVNTYNQHIAAIHTGTVRAEKRINDTLTGKLADRDASAMSLLTKVLASA